MFDNYMDRNDNLTLPNTPEDWEAFHWKLHFLGGASIRFVHYLLENEKKARRNAKKSNTCDENNVPQRVLD
jgi:hypothetical protein